MEHVTAHEAKAVLRYAQAVAQFIGLPRWRINVAAAPSSSDTLAQLVFGVEGYSAQLFLCSEWMTLDDRERRDTITHEVLHLTHTRVTTMVEKDTRPYMAKADQRDWHKRLNRELELMVDMLAGCLAETVELRRAWREAYQ